MSDKQETVADVVREMREYDNTPPPRRAWIDLADRTEAVHKREVERLCEVLDNVEDQVRWTIAHIKSGEYDDVTGALYTAEHALEYIKRYKEANDESAK